MHMKKIYTLFIGLFLLLLNVSSQVKISNPTCENKVNPSGIDTKAPRFSWQLNSDQRNTIQSAYEIRVSETKESLGKNKNIVWSSGKVNSDASVHIPYNGKELVSGKKYFWQVRVWDNTGKSSAWSDVGFWQMGLLSSADWQAKWIEPGYTEDTLVRPSPLFRKQFNTSKKIKSATLYITALGMYEAYLNGKKIGNDYLTPGWTSYTHRLQYQQYDVTNMLQAGNNALGVMLGSGWYRGFIGFSGQQNFYGRKMGLLCQMEIEYTDGSKTLVLSDENWKSSTGSILSAEIYNGETIDARKEKNGWLLAGYNDKDWSGVQIKTGKFPQLVATYNEPVRRHEVIKPVKMIITPKGEKVIDFGQNMVGWVKIKVRGNAGDKITIQHAEVLDKAGNFYTENLRAAKQENNYILRGGSDEIFEPHFTFQGFRYIKVEGYNGELQPENFTATALYSDMDPTGSFTCSNPLLNQLQSNIQWGQKGNFLDVPTDCPQRDERLGWTGDAQAFARTATFNMQVNNFFSKWLKDLAADQQPNGSVPFVIPNVLGAGAGAACSLVLTFKKYFFLQNRVKQGKGDFFV
jgi:alpha-L-rhamnosidase